MLTKARTAHVLPTICAHCEWLAQSNRVAVHGERPPNHRNTRDRVWLVLLLWFWTTTKNCEPADRRKTKRNKKKIVRWQRRAKQTSHTKIHVFIVGTAKRNWTRKILSVLGVAPMYHLFPCEKTSFLWLLRSDDGIVSALRDLYWNARGFYHKSRSLSEALRAVHRAHQQATNVSFDFGSWTFFFYFRVQEQDGAFGGRW